MKKTIILALILSCAFVAYSQTESQEAQQEVSRDLTVEREYDPVVANAKKIK